MRLSEWMSREGISQSQLAEMVGVDQPTISRWVRGRRAPSLEQAVRLQSISCGEITPTDLIGAEPDKAAS